MSHPELPLLCDAALAHEVGSVTALITTFSGGAPINVMRPPTASGICGWAAAAAAAGYPTLMLWDVDPRDWSGIAAATITARMLAAARDGSVVLLHAGPNRTPEALPSIIAGLRARAGTAADVGAQPGAARLELITRPSPSC